ncbi:unnamed protein product [Vitrella brassicaformis CCMP3155]|uniref:tRNA (guanine(46)-N(7))-methyltransferase n=2 Tax=Vitrella brassicaformis TaxID=1169539 RepID=A0A0G4EY82_VITBC|nr:unnamed protein product [Vitrella brassicaformis CCMP3155]|eukprot:CEM03589.1 unnamed protein product [Vitrella brassicaformis CCMP3155]
MKRQRDSQPRANQRQKRRRFASASRSDERHHRGREQQQLIHINQQISACTRKGRLGEAFQHFARISELNLKPTIVAYSSLINCCVRCGEMQRAAHLYERMQNQDGIAPNLIVYTTMVKGYSNQGNMAEAERLMDAMTAAGVQPNIRTLSALMRGYLRTGQLDRALKNAKHLVEAQSAGLIDGQLAPEEHSDSGGGGIAACQSSLAALVQLLAQAHLMSDAEGLVQLMGRLVDSSRATAEEGAVSILLAETYHNIAVAHALFGERKRARDCIGKARALSGSSPTPRSAAAASATASQGGGQQRSQQLFLKHRGKELRRDLDHLDNKLTTESAVTVTPDQLFSAFRRLVWTEGNDDSTQDIMVAEERGTHYGRRLSSFGLTDFLRRHTLRELKGTDTLSVRASEFFRVYGGQLSRRQHRFRWGRVFGEGGGLPVKVEVCSGGGEWVTAKASSEVGVSNWVAMELRHDRCYQMFSRGSLAALPNLCIVGGDAHAAMVRHFSSDSVAEVWVTFPQPPLWSGGSGHLLTGDFFNQIRRVLCVGGVVTVVSDSLPYCHTIHQQLSSATQLVSTHPHEPCVRGWPDGYAPLSDTGEGAGEGEGEGSGSSYFDRFWSGGKRTSRYFVRWRKE